MAENSDRRSVLGVLLLLVGAFLILNNLNIIPFYIPHYIFTWPVILIVLGVVFILTKGRNGTGFILISIGSVFLAMEAFHFSWRDVGGFWPIILVLVGIGLLIRNTSTRDHVPDEKKNDVDYIDEITIFGGTKKVINSQNFRGGKTTSLFGGTELIFQNATPVPEGAVIDVFTMFGGTDLIVPSDWNVKVDATAFLGGIDDKRSANITSDPQKTLIVKGFIMFGGCDIKSHV
jgi:predicted membrane protein